MMSSDVNTSLAEELSSSYLWQSAVSIACGLDHFHGAHVFFFAGATYENTPVCPTIFSPAIEWEQSIIEGHPTHPVGHACLSFIQHPVR